MPARGTKPTSGNSPSGNPMRYRCRWSIFSFSDDLFELPEHHVPMAKHDLTSSIGIAPFTGREKCLVLLQPLPVAVFETAKNRGQ